MGFLQGKHALITGIISHRSIAWGIAEAMHREGAQLAFTYVNDKLKPRVDEAAKTFGSDIVLPCDVSSDAQVLQTDFAPMAMGDAAGNTEPQTIALLLPGQTKVRFKYLFQTLLRYARALIVNGQNEGALIVINAQVSIFSVFEGVIYQVAHAATQGQGLARVRLEGSPL